MVALGRRLFAKIAKAPIVATPEGYFAATASSQHSHENCGGSAMHLLLFDGDLSSGGKGMSKRGCIEPRSSRMLRRILEEKQRQSHTTTINTTTNHQQRQDLVGSLSPRHPYFTGGLLLEREGGRRPDDSTSTKTSKMWQTQSESPLASAVAPPDKQTFSLVQSLISSTYCSSLRLGGMPKAAPATAWPWWVKTDTHTHTHTHQQRRIASHGLAPQDLHF